MFQSRQTAVLREIQYESEAQTYAYQLLTSDMSYANARELFLDTYGDLESVFDRIADEVEEDGRDFLC